MLPSALDAAALAADLETQVVGRSITCLRECGSTNDHAQQLAAAGAPDGAVVLADYQTAGRGRRGRAWLAPPGACLLASLILRPPLPATDASLLTMLAACAGAATVEAAGELCCSLKWPNDLLVVGAGGDVAGRAGDADQGDGPRRERKVGGILVEASYLGDDLELAVVGIGLNVNLAVAAHPEIAATATSLSDELGAELDRAALARELLRQLDARYARLLRDLARARAEPTAPQLAPGRALFVEWRRRLGTLGRRVTLLDDQGQAELVLAEDVAPDGALLARRADGSLRRLHFGEVSLR